MLIFFAISTFSLTVAMVYSWLFLGPNYPQYNDQVATEVVVQQYQRLAELHQQRHREMFQVVIAAAYIPLVTAVLGYLFGVQNSNKSAQE